MHERGRPIREALRLKRLDCRPHCGKCSRSKIPKWTKLTKRHALLHCIKTLVCTIYTVVKQCFIAANNTRTGRLSGLPRIARGSRVLPPGDKRRKVPQAPHILTNCIDKATRGSRAPFHWIPSVWAALTGTACAGTEEMTPSSPSRVSKTFEAVWKAIPAVAALATENGWEQAVPRV